MRNKKTLFCYTKEQLQVIQSNLSVFVSTSAGTGKTLVIVGRLIRLILEGRETKKILCLTYTNNAALEMKNRLNKFLNDLLSLSEEELITNVKSITKITFKNTKDIRDILVKILYNRNIGIRFLTFHSFCKSILDEYGSIVGITPFYKILDSNPSLSLINKLLEKIGNLNGEKISPFIEGIQNHSRINSIESLYNVISFLIRNKKKLVKVGKEEILELKSSIKKERRIPFKTFSEWNQIDKWCKENYYRKTYEKIKINLKNMSTGTDNYDDYIRAFLTKSNRLYKSKKICPLFDEMRKSIERKNFIIETKIKKLRELIEEVFKKNLYDIYHKYKEENNLLDFEDLTEKTKQIIFRPDILSLICQNIENILIDEAQDTNDCQWVIIKKIYEKIKKNHSHASLFIVGDKKQAIMSFVNEEINSSLQSPFGQSDNNTPYLKKFFLNISFRSSKLILNFVDKYLLEKRYNLDIENKSNYLNWGSSVEYYEEKKEGKAAILIANKIYNIINEEKMYLDSEKRYASARDIMILVSKRTHNFYKNEITRELNKLNIKVEGKDSGEIKEHPLIIDFINFSDFIILPEDDANFALLLKSSFFNITNRDLLKIKEAQVLLKKDCWWETMKNIFLSKTEKDVKEHFNFYEEEKLKTATFSLNKFINYYHDNNFSPVNLYCSIFVEFYEQIDKAYATDMDFIFNIFLDTYKTFSRNNNNTNLYEFVLWFQNEKLSYKKDSSTERTGVEILTVHGAKGLEAPIVFYCDIDQQVKDINEDKNIHVDYVAMTRAKEHLFLIKRGSKERIKQNFFSNSKEIKRVLEFFKSKKQENNDFIYYKLREKRKKEKENNKFCFFPETNIFETFFLGNKNFILNKDKKKPVCNMDGKNILGEIFHKFFELFLKNNPNKNTKEQELLYIEKMKSSFLYEENKNIFDHLPIFLNEGRQIIKEIKAKKVYEEREEVSIGKNSNNTEDNFLCIIDKMLQNKNEIILIDYKFIFNKGCFDFNKYKDHNKNVEQIRKYKNILLGQKKKIRCYIIYFSIDSGAKSVEI